MRKEAVPRTDAPQASGRADEAVLPLVEEELKVDTREVQTGRVSVRTVTEHVEEIARVALATSEAEITRVPVGREVAEAPPVRQDGDVLVIPVLEEVAVIERRLVLREEVRIRMRSATDTVEVPVTLRRQHATVERQPADPNPTAGPTPAPGEDEAHD
jgi:uncharacterized protein (TIGR02271 family)